MKKFYTHLIEIETIIVELQNMDLSKEERVHLAHLVDSSLHHTVLDAILSELSSEDKKIFLSHLKEDNHDKIWQFLNSKVDNIETKIKKAAKDLTEELEKDLKKVKKLE